MKKINYIFILFCTHFLSQTFAEELDLNDYYGTWITELNNEALYLIIHKNNSLTYFYKESKNNKINKGSWKISEDGNFNISLTSNTYFIFNIEDKIISNSSVSYQIEPIKKDSIGTLTKPPDYKKEKTDKTSNFFGLWEASLNENEIVLFIKENRSVYKDIISLKEKNHIIGKWEKHGDQLHITWDDGSYSICKSFNEFTIEISNIKAGEEISNKSMSQYISTKKLSKKDKLEKIINSDYHKVSVLNSLTFKELKNFYKGSWYYIDERKLVHQIKLSNFGKVIISTRNNLKGNWYISNKGPIINLEDGSRMKIVNVGSSFLILNYKINRPIDGYPNIVYNSAPKKRSKLNSLEIVPTKSLALLDQISEKYLKSNQNFSKYSLQVSQINDKPFWWPIWTENKIDLSFNDDSNIKKPKQKVDWKWPF